MGGTHLTIKYDSQAAIWVAMGVFDFSHERRAYLGPMRNSLENQNETATARNGMRTLGIGNGAVANGDANETEPNGKRTLGIGNGPVADANANGTEPNGNGTRTTSGS